MALTFYLLLFINGGNDIIAYAFNLSFNAITWFTRIALFVLPPLAFVITKRICLGLQRRDKNKVLHGRETGIIKRLPNGEFIEVHAPIPAAERYTLTAHDEYLPVEAGPNVDENGVRAPGGMSRKVRARLSKFWFGD